MITMKTEPLKILILDDNSPFVLPLLRSFSGRPDIKLDVLVNSRQKLNHFRYSRYLRNYYKVEPFNEENFEGIVKEYILKTSADLVIPTREWISKLIYQKRTELEKLARLHPVSDLNTIDTINDKWNLNSWLEQNGFPASRSFRINKDTVSDQFLDSLSYPVLLKPFKGIGGKGIKMIRSRESLKSELESSDIYAGTYLIQEYINGYDIDMSFFAIDGKILFYTIQKGLVLGQLSYARGIEFVKNKELFDITSAIVRELKYTGIAHLDFRYDTKKEKFFLIDFNARYWSSLEGSRNMGVNFPVLAAEYSMGIPFDYPDYSTGTFYFAATAIKTFVSNIFSGKKYPINLAKSELRSIVLDPVPELVHTGKKIVQLIQESVNGRKPVL
jgi:D-aspartate ligase